MTLGRRRWSHSQIMLKLSVAANTVLGKKKMNYFIGKFLPVVTNQQFLGCFIIPIDIGIELIIGNLEMAGVACFFRGNIARKDGITLGKVAMKCVKSN